MYIFSERGDQELSTTVSIMFIRHFWTILQYQCSILSLEGGFSKKKIIKNWFFEKSSNFNKMMLGVKGPHWQSLCTSWKVLAQLLNPSRNLQKIGHFSPKFEVGKEILKEFLTVKNAKSCSVHQFFKCVQTSSTWSWEAELYFNKVFEPSKSSQHIFGAHWYIVDSLGASNWPQRKMNL